MRRQRQIGDGPAAPPGRRPGRSGDSREKAAAEAPGLGRRQAEKSGEAAVEAGAS